MQVSSLHLRQNTELFLENQKDYRLFLEIEGEQSLKLHILPQAHIQLYIEVQGRGNLHLSLELEEKSQCNYLFLNSSDEHLQIQEKIVLQKESKLIANYGELSRGKHNKTTECFLDGEAAHLEMHGASIVFDELRWNVSALHRAKNTYAFLKNYGVISPEASLSFEVLGHILKGFSRSAAHQVTRILNMNLGKRAEVFPKLVIDENDVEASHAASVGQVDPEMIYYLKSRGIPQEQVLALLTMGYLMPILDSIENEEIKNELYLKIKKCVAYAE